MKLSELKTGEKGVIVKVLGHGGFRKRIVEMGFIKGKVVEVLLNAPLRDPVKYRLMGYEISLRHAEADMIEVISEAEALRAEPAEAERVAVDHPIVDLLPVDSRLRDAAMRRRRIINVALVGNPNCGKTSLFNYASGAHERVGNYAGVTVDAKEAVAHFEGYEFHLVDLPGTYSLSAYSPEELYVRKQIIEHTPDVVINVLDASNLERNLYLTTQLVDMNLRMVCALNMYDEFTSRGDRLDHHTLGRLFGVPMIPTVFRTGEGVDRLFHVIINLYEGADFVDKEGNIDPEVAHDLQQWHDTYAQADLGDHDEDYAHGSRPHQSVYRHIHLNHGRYIEEAIDLVKEALRRDEQIRHRYSTRYLAIKLLERDAEVADFVRSLPDADHLLATRDRAAALIEAELKEDSETAIMNAKYAFIHGALQEAQFAEGTATDIYQTTHVIDRLLTNRYLGFPLFFLLLYVMFQVTFSLGQYPMDWIDAGVQALSDWLARTMPAGALRDLLVDGVIGGVGSVIIFLPQILLLYGFISFMEDSGYMARAAFIMDRPMHKIGLHGKSFIPLIMGFGCNVPAVMATRTIESRRSRLITMLVVPLMSCSARLPVYVLLAGAFFSTRYQGLVMILLYALGILAAALMSRLFSRFVVRGDDVPFVMELPPYRFPTAKAIIRHTWAKGREYLKKMGGIILVASIVVWALGYFPRADHLPLREQQAQSYLGRLGRCVEPVFRPLGFSWQLDVGLLSGVGAKEIVASSLGVLYGQAGEEAETESSDASSTRSSSLYAQLTADGVTPLTAFCYLLFVLLYFPCLATLAAIRNESGRWRWALFAAAYTTLLAWAVAFVVRQAGLLFGLQ